MIINILTVVAGIAGAPPVAVAVAPAPLEKRPLASLPDTTVKYYDVPGRTAQAIEKNLKGMMANPAMTDLMRPYNWNVGAQVGKQTTGPKCIVTAVKIKQTSAVNLPRLSDLAKVNAPTVANWNNYVATLQNDAAANLWFVHDHLPAIERSLVNMPCEKVGDAWNSALANLKTQQLALASRNAASSAAAAAAAKTGKKKGDDTEVELKTSDY
jgi:predicted secreted Zn-dependent protease